MGGKLFGVDQLVEGISVINGPKMDKFSKQSNKKNDYLASSYALIELFSFFLLGGVPMLTS